MTSIEHKELISILAMAATLTILLLLVVIFCIHIQQGRDEKCRQQYGDAWYYTRQQGADCINRRTGDGKFFKG